MTSLGDKVRVKPLEWDDLTGTGTRFRSYDGLKSYTISRIVQDNVAYFRWARSQGGWSGVFYDADACKAAAQADYEARIMAALDLSPPVVEEGALRAYIERLRNRSAFAFGHTEAEHRGADEIKAVVIADLEAMLSAASPSKPEEGARPLGPHTEEERMCFARGMEQWRASLKRSDLTEEDRVKGALDAYCRQAFALSLPLASPVPEPQAVAWRDETEAEHISRDIKEGRFPARSEKQQRPAIADAWERMRDDSELDAARRKLSMLRRIIKHAVDAHVELAAAAPLSGGGKVEAEWRVIDDKVAGPVTVCRFGDADHSWLPMTAYRVSGGKWERPASRDSLPYDPTHWMPLPAALATMGGK